MKKDIKRIIQEKPFRNDDDTNVMVERMLEMIKYNFYEYTNFLNENYKPFAGNWIRVSDDKIIYNCSEIVEDFFKIQNEKSN
jgi:hypothetical protein